MKKLWIIPIMFLLVGCATTADRQLFYDQQRAFIKEQLDQTPKPFVRLEAVAGKSIENLALVEVSVPRPQYDIKDFKQFSEAHPAWEVAGTVIRTAGQVLGIYFVADGVKSIFETVTKNAGGTAMTVSGTGNTASIAPTHNVVSGTGNYGAGTSPPTVVTAPDPIIVNPVIVTP